MWPLGPGAIAAEEAWHCRALVQALRPGVSLNKWVAWWLQSVGQTRLKGVVGERYEEAGSYR